MPCPAGGAREQVVAQGARRVIPSWAAWDSGPEATARFTPSASSGSSYLSARRALSRPQSMPQAYCWRPTRCSLQPARRLRRREEKERRGFPMMGLVLGIPSDRGHPPRLRHLRLHARYEARFHGLDVRPSTSPGNAHATLLAERDHGGLSSTWHLAGAITVGLFSSLSGNITPVRSPLTALAAASCESDWAEGTRPAPAACRRPERLKDAAGQSESAVPGGGNAPSRTAPQRPRATTLATPRRMASAAGI